MTGFTIVNSCVLFTNAEPVKTARLCTEFRNTMSNIFQICPILWHFEDGAIELGAMHGSKSLKMSNCLSFHKDHKNVFFDPSSMRTF